MFIWCLFGVERAVVEELDILLEAEHSLLCTAKTVREVHLLDGRVGGESQGISQQRECGNRARSHELRCMAWGGSKVVSGWEVEPRREAQVVGGDATVVEGMCYVFHHFGGLVQLADGES